MKKQDNNKDMDKFGMYCYNILSHANWDTNKVAEAAVNKEGVSTVRLAARDYAVNVLGMSLDEYYSNIESFLLKEYKNTIKKDIALLERISDSNTDEEFKQIAAEYYGNRILINKDYQEKLQRYIDVFRSNEEIEEEMIYKIDRIKLFYRELRERELLSKKQAEYFEENEINAMLLVSSFVESRYKDVDTFCYESGISIMDFYENVVITKFTDHKLYVDFKEKENIVRKPLSEEDREECKYYYDSWREVNWNSDLLTEKFGLHYANIARRKAREYALLELGISHSEFYLENRLFNGQLYKSNLYSTLFEELSDSDISLIECYNITSKYFASDIDLKVLTQVNASTSYYLNGYRQAERDEVEKDIRLKFNLVRDYIRNQKINSFHSRLKDEKIERDLQKLDEAVSLLEKYTSEATSIAEFARKSDINDQVCRAYFRLVKDLRPQLYEELMEKRQNYVDNVKFNNLKDASIMLDLMEAGILQKNGTFRDFDLLDYYSLSDMNVTKFFDNIKSELSKEEIGKFARLLAIDSRDVKVKEADIHAIKQEFFVEDGIRRITKEEKEVVINCLKSNNVPLTNELYLIAVKRLLEGNLDLDVTLKESVLSNVNKGSARIKKED